MLTRDHVRCSKDLYTIAEEMKGTTSEQYLRAIGKREETAIHSLTPQKQMALFYGPGLYRPSSETKFTALRFYQQLVNHLIPDESPLAISHIWHDDLHDENIFVDAENPQKITGIIDWQSCHISPLFSHNHDPAFLSYKGLEPETLDYPPQPDFANLSTEERALADYEYITQNVFIGWRRLMKKKNPTLYQCAQFRKTAMFGLFFLIQRIFEYGEAHFMSLLVDLKETWSETSDKEAGAFPITLSESDVQKIKHDCDCAIAGTEMVAETQKALGGLWPEKGFVENEYYDEAKAVLEKVKAKILEVAATTEEERKEIEKFWPFED